LKWQTGAIPRLKSIKLSDHPKELIERFSEQLLETFRTARLIDAYEVYQHLMDYWDVAMQDDVYQLVQEGWKGVIQNVPNADLIPQFIVIRRYFAEEQALITKLEADRDVIAQRIDELEQEQGSEEGLLADARNEKGKITKNSLRKRLDEIQSETGLADERKMLKKYQRLMEEEAVASKAVKEAQYALDAKLDAKYRKLTTEEIKTLVVDDKWLAKLSEDIHGEVERVNQQLTDRVRELAERYEQPLPSISEWVSKSEAVVSSHLRQMGYSW
jgi:type I restriction enzyme M protein